VIQRLQRHVQESPRRRRSAETLPDFCSSRLRSAPSSRRRPRRHSDSSVRLGEQGAQTSSRARRIQARIGAPVRLKRWKRISAVRRRTPQGPPRSGGLPWTSSGASARVARESAGSDAPARIPKLHRGARAAQPDARCRGAAGRPQAQSRSRTRAPALRASRSRPGRGTNGRAIPESNRSRLDEGARPPNPPAHPFPKSPTSFVPSTTDLTKAADSNARLKAISTQPWPPCAPRGRVARPGEAGDSPPISKSRAS